MSIVVPFREPMVFRDGVDDRDVEWRHGGQSIYLGAAFNDRSSERFDRPAAEGCMLHVNGRRVLASERVEGRDRYVLEDFDMPCATDSRWISVRAHSSRDACLMVAKVA
ncbi:MAG TPA: hypothetical protein VGH80_01130 [Xanthomonadaceae bacterium]